MTNTQKTDAVRAAYQRLLDERPGWATLAEVLKDPEAERMLAHIDRGLAKLRAEDARLKAELAGTSDPAAHFHEAIEHTRRIEAEFRQDLARMGHPHQTSPAVRRQIEETALGYIEQTHGPHAREHCRRLLEPRGAAAVEPGPSVPFLPA